MNPWIHTVEKHRVAECHNLESVFTQSNGYLGIRGYEEEGVSGAGSDPMQFVAGYFDRSPVTRNTMVNIPTVKRIRIALGGENLDTGTGSVRGFHRSLDMSCAVSERAFTWTSPQGRTTEVSFLSYLSYPRHHLYLTEINVRPLNWSGRVGVEDVFDGSGLTLHQKHFGITGCGDWENGQFCGIRTLTSKMDAALVCAYETNRPARQSDPSVRIGNCVLKRASYEVRRGGTLRIRRYAAVATDFDREAGKTGAFQRATRCLRQAMRLGWRGLRREQNAAWKTLWSQADIRIDGDPVREFQLRFSIFQMLQAYRPGDSRLSIGAKFLSGEHYSGHYFWDTDIFLTPFYLFTMPQAARNLVEYRVRNIAGARIKARSKKFRGAFYPWEACAIDGRENCPEWWKDKAAPEPIYIPCGNIELHINSAVAMAATNYMDVAGMARPPRGEIHRMLVDIARFWASRGIWKHGRFSIRNVIGPDEYHEYVDDNAYTNHTASWCLRKALTLAGSPESAARLGVAPKEIAEWKRIVRCIEPGHEERRGILAQDSTFLGLAELDRSKFKPLVPLFRQISMHEIGKLQAIKQADVLALFHLLPFDYDLALMQRCWDYYEPRTLHDSNLSAGSHAVVAALLRRPDAFRKYYDKVLTLDIGGGSYNVEDGLHAANAGNAWSSTVIGAAGIRWTEDHLCCAPQLLKEWKSLSFRLIYRKRPLRFQIGRKAVTIRCPGGRVLNMIVAGRAVRISRKAQTVTIPLDPPALVLSLENPVADDGLLLNGIRPLLTRLKLAGVRLAVASSDRDASALIRQAGLDPCFFDAVVNGDEIPEGSPPFYALLMAAKRAGVKPSKCLCAVSARSGPEACHRAGMASLAVGPAAPRSCDWHRRSLTATTPGDIFAFMARIK